MKREIRKNVDLSGTIESTAITSANSDQNLVSTPFAIPGDTNLWDSTFNAVEDAISIIDNKQRIVRCNKAMLKFSVNENEVLIGKHCYEVVHGTEHPHPECPFQKMLQTNQRESTELQEGGQWFDVTVDPLFTPDKQLNGAVHIVRNITGRKIAEDALKANYSLLRTAGRTAKFGGWKLNLIKKKLTWSDEVAAIHEMPAGYSPKLEEGINFYAPEWRDTITNALNSCVENGTPFDEELELITANAKRIWVRSTGEAVRNKSGNISKIYGSFQDISEHKLREQLISEGEANARAIMESTSDTMVLLNKDGIVIASNEGHANRLKLTRNDILGKNIFDYLPDEVGKKRKELIDLAVATGEPQHGEDIRADRWIEYSIHPIFDHNKPIERVAIFAKDVTEQRQMTNEIRKSEELLSLFMQHSPIYSYIKEVTPTQSVVLKASKNFKDMIGISGSEIVGKTMYDLFPPEFAKKITFDDWETFLGGNPKTLEEELFGRYYNTIKFPISQEGKNLIAGYSIDVTTQKLAEVELMKNETRLRELNATKDKFFSIIAHDLKSPFNSIIGFSNILVQRIQENDYNAIEKYAGIIQNSSQQAMDLLMNLLEWSQSQTGRIVYLPEYIDIIALINKSIDLLIGSAQQKAITIHLKTPGIKIVHVDEIMINIVIRNLISNAIKFTYPGGNVVISAEQNPEELIVTVTDDGKGMNKTTLDNLFRIEETHSTIGTRNEKGTGLGLILCKEFIDKHNGRIWVESEPGKGSTFFFSVPNRNTANS